MEDDTGNGFLEGFKKEWKLFLQTFEEDTYEKNNQERSSIEDPDEDELDLDGLDASEVAKSEALLNQKRRDLFKKLDSLRREVNLVEAKLESLTLVGGDVDNQKEILNLLLEKGRKLQAQLEDVDSDLKNVRDHVLETKED